MYGLPPSFNPSVFVGLRVETILFAENLLSIGFGEKFNITVLGTARYTVAGANAPNEIRVPPKESNLMRLLGQTVLSASAVGGGTLILSFENRDRLELLDDSDQYEAYKILADGNEVIV